MALKPTPLFWLLIAILVIAILYGFYYYIYAFQQTSPLLWLFVPDSPLSILFALIVILGILKGRLQLLLQYLASISLIKYGIWTIAIMGFFYPQEYLSQGRLPESLLLFIIPHIGMVALAILTLPSKRSLSFLSIALLFFLLNDYLDYFGGIEQNIIPTSNFLSIATFTFLLTLFSSFSVLLLANNPILTRASSFIYSKLYKK